MSNTDGCDGCTRRSMLQGLAVASLVPIAACKAEDDNPGVDGGVNDGPPGDTGFEMCGANVCVDLASAANAPLAAVGGNRTIQVGTEKIIITKTSDTTFATVSAICTHQRCTVRLASVATGYACPCHGSKYTIDGAVTQGPAVTALKNYTNSVSGTTLTITL